MSEGLVIDAMGKEIFDHRELIAEMLQLLEDMDKRIVWEYAGVDRNFQERVEIAIYAARDVPK